MNYADHFFPCERGVFFKVILKPKFEMDFGQKTKNTKEWLDPYQGSIIEGLNTRDLLALTSLDQVLLGATTFSIMTLSIMTLSILTLNIMTLSIMTLSITTLLSAVFYLLLC
jgi:hypothetical protein